jgi:hypothetical protein
MKRTLFVKDLRARREFVWQCPLEENAGEFLNLKVGHPDWELTEELKEFDKGEAVKVGDETGVVDDVFRTPFLLRERKLVASQRNPIYRIKIGEGMAYVTADQLTPKVKMLNAIHSALHEEDLQLLTEFLQNLVNRVHRIDLKLLKEQVEPVRERAERLLEGDNLKVFYAGVYDVLDESSIEEEMGSLNVYSRHRLVSRCYRAGVKLPQVTSESGFLGLTAPEMKQWQEALGEGWEDEFTSWLEEGFSPTEVQAFVKSSRDPQECAIMRDTPLTLEDLVNG